MTRSFTRVIASPPSAASILQLSALVEDGAVFDGAGRMIRSIRNSAVLQLEGIPPGVYLVRTTEGDELRFIRL